jgi:SAM-dependent methyltransferase
MNFFRRSEITPAVLERLAAYDRVVAAAIGAAAPPLRMRDWELCRVLDGIEGAGAADPILELGSFNTYLGAFLGTRYSDVTVSDRLGHRRVKSLCRRLGLAPRKPHEASYGGWMRSMRRAGLRPRDIDAARIDFPDRSLGRVIALSVIEHIPVVERAIAEIYRVLRPGGRGLITMDCAPEPKPYGEGVRYFSPAELEALFSPYPVTSARNAPDFSRENWCYGRNRPIVPAFIEITRPAEVSGAASSAPA